MKELINVFLQSFNYLTTKNKRSSSCFCSFFHSKSLTQKIETHALHLKESLIKYAAESSDKITEDSIKNLYNMIGIALEAVKLERLRSGYIERISHEYGFDEFVIPKEPGQFEKQIVIALIALRQKLIDKVGHQATEELIKHYHHFLIKYASTHDNYHTMYGSFQKGHGDTQHNLHFKTVDFIDHTHPTDIEINQLYRCLPR